MTKEELEKEAEEWLCNNLHSASEEDFIKAMVDIAEPREKRIEELIALINAERERQEKCDDVHLRTIADLEKENAELKYQLTHRNCLDCSNHSSKLRMRNLELEKENAELKCECRRCVYSDCPCILSDYGKDRNGICEHFKDVFDENAELKEYNKYLKRQRQGGIQKQYNKVAIIKQQDDQLTKAKVCLEQLVSEITVGELEVDPNILQQSENFLKEE